MILEPTPTNPPPAGESIVNWTMIGALAGLAMLVVVLLPFVPRIKKRLEGYWLKKKMEKDKRLDNMVLEKAKILVEAQNRADLIPEEEIELGSESEPNFNGSFDAIKPAIDKLSIELAKFHPDLILGISVESLVGGTIVGAWLASDSCIGRPEMFRQLFRSSDGLELSDGFKEKIRRAKKILLIDDESNTGTTVKRELNGIRAINANTEIRVAVIVVREASWKHLDRKCKAHTNMADCTINCSENVWGEDGIGVCCYSNVANYNKNDPSTDIKWPWKTRA